MPPPKPKDESSDPVKRFNESYERIKKGIKKGGVEVQKAQQEADAALKAMKEDRRKSAEARRKPPKPSR
jgi:hypothetical protein